MFEMGDQLNVFRLNFAPSDLSKDIEHWQSELNNSPWPPHINNSVPVHPESALLRVEGALSVGIGAQLLVPGVYMQPVLTEAWPSTPPHTIILVPVHAIE